MATDGWDLVDEMAEQLGEAKASLKAAEQIAELAGGRDGLYGLSFGERTELTQILMSLDEFIERTGLYTPGLVDVDETVAAGVAADARAS